MRSVVLIPTYNEIDSLPTALDRVRSAAVQAHILVIDDNSPDGTGDLADARAQDDDHIHVLHRTEKNGLGPAYLAGFKWALENDFELIIEMDADGSHRAEDLALLIQRAEIRAGSVAVLRRVGHKSVYCFRAPETCTSTWPWG